jgi:hypothetical protein
VFDQHHMARKPFVSGYKGWILSFPQLLHQVRSHFVRTLLKRGICRHEGVLNLSSFSRRPGPIEAF